MNKKETAMAVKVSTDQPAWLYLKTINNASPSLRNRIAITDGCKKYTYAEMFLQWERYAAVFSALKMTEKHGARVGLIGSTSAETVFAMYGLNTVGAEVSLIAPFSVFNKHKLIQTIQNEKLTDIILTDDFVQPDTLTELFNLKMILGLNHILFLHIPIGGPCINQALTYGQEYKYAYLKNWVDAINLETLLKKYEKHPISFGTDVSKDTAFILHTSGTSTGIGKPIPLSDKALNYFGNCYYKIKDVEKLLDDAVCGLTIDLSNAYGLVNQLHGPMAVNGTVAMVPGAAFNPLYFKAIPTFGITVLFCTSALLEMWLRLPAATVFDFSSLKGFIIGGTSVSAEDKRRYAEFLHKNGAGEIVFINGYGLSELGGACILSTPQLEDESIGYPLSGLEVCLYDEDNDSYLFPQDAPCNGVLYLRSEAMTCGQLDGKEIIKQETIGNKQYICSNDLVSMAKDGKISFLGRANRYFINDSGMKYESGKVEAAFSGQKGIESCGVIAVYAKATHDNIPMLCVKPLVNDETAPEVIRKALLKVFTGKNALSKNNIPLRIFIAEDLPRNPNGKIDICAISKNKLQGTQYSVETEYKNNAVANFRLLPYEENPDDVIQQVTKNIAEDIYADYVNNGLNNNYFNFKMEDMNMNNFKNAQEFFNGMNQMGSQMGNQWMNMMNWNGQMNQMNQLNQMMMAYANQMYQLAQQTAEAIYKQNNEMLAKINELVQKDMEKKETEADAE